LPSTIWRRSGFIKDGIELVRVLDAARDIDTLFQEDDPL